MSPRDAEAHIQMGKSHRGQGRWLEAEAALHKALALDPKNGCARIELGSIFEDQEKFMEAAVEFERAIAMDSNRGGAHCQLGRIYSSQGRWPEAEEALRRALEFDPRNGRVLMELGALYQGQERFSEAEAEFEKVIAIDPRSSGAHFHLGVIHCSRGRRLEAEVEFQKALAIDPHNVGAYLRLGEFHLLWGQWAEAEAEFQKVAALEPRDDGAYIGLWAVYRGQGRSAEAEAALAKAAAINPKSAVVCTELMDRLYRDRALGCLAGRAGAGAGGEHLGAPCRFGSAGSGGLLSSSLARDGAADPTGDRVFCLLPWTTLHIRTDGSSRPCCLWSGPSLGNAHSSSIDDLWNSPNMKALRLDMMRGRPRAGCWRCYKDERTGFRSNRQAVNVSLDRHRGRERLTAPDGTLPRHPVPLLDIRFSNVCNLRCRTCDKSQSSSWMADAQALGLPVEGGPILKPYDDWDAFWRQLQPVLQEGLEEISFVGGEPLIMEEHYRILDFLIARGLTDVRLTYNTNFSTLRFQGRDVIDLWSRFHDVRVLASLDGSGRRGEYLRKGLNWEAVVANRKEMLHRCPDVAFSIFATLSIFNALHLPDFHREWVEKGYILHDAFVLTTLVTPEMYRMQVLPPTLKERVLESCRRHQESFLVAGGTVAQDFAAAALSLQAQDCSELLPEFVAMTRRLDQLRGENCCEIFPELAELFEAAA